jgi:hypothetical protein
MGEGHTDGRTIDRRATGAQRVIIPDGNGGKVEFFQVNIGRAQMWLNACKAFIALILVIAGAMWGAVRFGVQSEVHQEVEAVFAEEMKPGGDVDRHMHEISQEAIEEVQGVIQDDFDYQDRRLDRVETDIGQIKAGIEHLKVQQDRNVDEIRLLLQQAIEEGGAG